MASIAAASSTRTAPSADAEAVPRLAVVDMDVTNSVRWKARRANNFGANICRRVNFFFY
jgi:hypothetical protein